MYPVARTAGVSDSAVVRGRTTLVAVHFVEMRSPIRRLWCGAVHAKSVVRNAYHHQASQVHTGRQEPYAVQLVPDQANSSEVVNQLLAGQHGASCSWRNAAPCAKHLVRQCPLVFSGAFGTCAADC
jgi:hypothetical protein